MTPQDLTNQIKKLIDREYTALERATASNARQVRRLAQAATRELWDKASEIATVDGVTTYVSRAEAFKYGRFDKLTKELHGVVRNGAVIDIRNIEFSGSKIYDIQYNGSAWVYQQGYALPVTGGVKVRLVSQALYSDFYGDVFVDRLKKNWAGFEDQILQSVRRGLNQGQPYQEIAQTISELTDRRYSNSLAVARTEAHRIQATAQEDSIGLLDELDVEYRKMWVATIDDRTRDDHADMDGELADENGIFQLPSGASGPEPGLTGNAADDISCRCASIVIINGEKPTQRRIRGEGIVEYETFRERYPRVNLTDVRSAK